MARLFLQARDPDGFEVRELDADRWLLETDEAGQLLAVPATTPTPESTMTPKPGPPQPHPPPLLVLARPGQPSEAWVVLSVGPGGLVVNGRALSTGLKRLSHRDELRIGVARAWFSSECPARVEPYGGERELLCPRCQLPIEPGQPSVRCPICKVVHHQLTGRDCWTHVPQCAGCQTPTILGAELAWSPERLQ
jgi:hypothetical protein